MIGRALALLMLFVAAPAAAQDALVTASIEPTTAREGDTVQYTVRIDSNGQKQLRVLSDPTFGALQFLGSSRGTEFKSTPQGAQLSYTFTYTLRARKKGTYTIGSPKVSIGDSVQTAKDVKIKIVGRGEKAPNAGSTDGPVFVRAAFSELRPYVGEQVLVEVALYTDERRVGPFGVEVADIKAPSYDGFWIEDLANQLRPQPRRKTVGGRTYSVRPVQVLSIFPLRPGTVIVEPLSMTAEVSGRVGMRRRATTLETKPAAIEVRPLPPGGPPKFSPNNVGQYTFKATTDKRKVAVGEPLVVRLTARGTGMVGLLEMPGLPESDAYRLLDPVFQKNIGVIGQKVGGDKTAEIVLTPLKEGVLTVPPITLHTFDPEKEAYVPLTSKAIQVAVAGKAVSAVGGEVELVERAGVKPKALQVAEQPLETLRPLGAASGSGEMSGVLFWSGLLVPALIYGLWLGFVSWSRRRQESAPDRRKKSAPKDARRALDEASELAKADGVAAMSKVSEALVGYLAEALDVPSGGITASKLRRLLPERGVDAETVEALIALRERCDQARFAGALSGEAGASVKEARGVLESLIAALGSAS